MQTDRGVPADGLSPTRWRALWVACAVALVGCATVPGPVRPRQVRVERPEATPEYDVLVGEFEAADGNFEQARSAYLRALAKDPTSPYLERKVAGFSAQLDDLDDAIEHAERAVALEPDDEQGRLFLGRLYRIRRDVAGAERVLLDASGQPIGPGAGQLLYQVYLERGRLSDALAIATGLVESHPDELGGYMALATVYERMGRVEDAAAALRDAIARQPDRFVLYSRLARLHRFAGDRDAEIAVYREVLDAHPDHYGSLVSLGETLIGLEDVDGAAEVYRQVVELYPDDLQSVRRLASLELSLGQSQRAVALLRTALAAHPQNLELAYALGQVLRSVGDEQGAREVFGLVPPDHPAYAEARLQIAAIYEDGGDYAAALAEIERARAVRPARVLDLQAAALLVRQGDLDAGVGILDALLQAEPNDEELLYQMGVLYGMAKQVDEALRYMRLALEQDPDNARALNYIGYTWAERGENLDQAEAMILRALELRPNDGYIADSLGWVYYMRARPLMSTGRSGDALTFLERAREQLQLAAELTGGDPVVSEHLGDVHMLLDEKERAYEFYQEAVDLEYREDEQPHLLEKLDGLRRELEQR